MLFRSTLERSAGRDLLDTSLMLMDSDDEKEKKKMAEEAKRAMKEKADSERRDKERKEQETKEGEEKLRKEREQKEKERREQEAERAKKEKEKKVREQQRMRERKEKEQKEEKERERVRREKEQQRERDRSNKLKEDTMVSPEKRGSGSQTGEKERGNTHNNHNRAHAIPTEDTQKESVLSWKADTEALLVQQREEWERKLSAAMTQQQGFFEEALRRQQAHHEKHMKDLSASMHESVVEAVKGVKEDILREWAKERRREEGEQQKALSAMTTRGAVQSCQKVLDALQEVLQHQNKGL